MPFIEVVFPLLNFLPNFTPSTIMSSVNFRFALMVSFFVDALKVADVGLVVILFLVVEH